jgi:hypothetical protein
MCEITAYGITNVWALATHMHISSDDGTSIIKIMAFNSPVVLLLSSFPFHILLASICLFLLHSFYLEFIAKPSIKGRNSVTTQATSGKQAVVSSLISDFVMQLYPPPHLSPSPPYPVVLCLFGCCCLFFPLFVYCCVCVFFLCVFFLVVKITFKKQPRIILNRMWYYYEMAE